MVDTSTHHSWAQIKFRKAKALLIRKSKVVLGDNTKKLMGDKSHHGDTKSHRKSALGDKYFLKSVAQVAVMSPAEALGDKTDLAGVSTPCTPKAAKRKRHPNNLACKIYFRVTNAEYQQKHAEAEAYGISLSDWARASFLAHHLPVPRPTAAAIREALVAFSRVANNLNQIAHKANCDQNVTSDMATIRVAMLPVIRRFHQIEGLDP